jgi:hypothetical protein
MSLIALALNLLLAGLLLLALWVGVRLNGRLKALRDSHAGFEKAVAELNEAAGRAEAGLAALRTMTEEANDSLLSRIESARTHAVRLERAVLQAERASEMIATAKLTSSTVGGGVAREGRGEASGGGKALAAIAALVGDGPQTPVAPPKLAPSLRPAALTSSPPSRRSRSNFDEDLFEGGGEAASPTPNAGRSYLTPRETKVARR